MNLYFFNCFLLVSNKTNPNIIDDFTIIMKNCALKFLNGTRVRNEAEVSKCLKLNKAILKYSISNSLNTVKNV